MSFVGVYAVGTGCCNVFRVSSYKIFVNRNMQKSTESSVDYFRRKVLTLKEKVEELAKLLQSRKMALQQVDKAILQKAGPK